MKTEFRRQAMVRSFVLVLVCTALLSLPVWGEWNVRLLKDLTPGAAGLPITKAVAADNLSYFITTKTADVDYRLNRTDGTAAGTYELCPLGDCYSRTGEHVCAPAAIGSQAIFVRNNANMLQLWQSDGTVAGTTALKDLGDPDDFRNNPGDFITVGNLVFFTLSRGVLWRSDGTAPGTFLVKDFYAEYGLAGSGSASATFTRYFCARDGLLYLIVGDAFHPQCAVWSSNGTPEGTQPVMQWSTDYDINGLWNTPGGLYAAWDWRHYTGYPQLQVYEQHVARIVPQGTPQSDYVAADSHSPTKPFGFAWLKGQACFGVNIAPQLWKVNGETAPVKVADLPTELVHDNSTGPLLAATDRAVVFPLFTDAEGTELWTSDGTAGGTHLLKDFTSGPESSEFTLLPFDSGELLACVKDGVSGAYSLWKTDGTEAGTVQALQLPNAVDPANICKFKGGYLLPYSTPETGVEPYFLYEGPFAVTRRLPLGGGIFEVNATVTFVVEVPEWARAWTTYQWMFNGAPITGATEAELVLPAVQLTNSGRYSCRVVYNIGDGDTILESAPMLLSVVKGLSTLNAPMTAVLSLLLCFAAAASIARASTRRQEHAGE